MPKCEHDAWLRVWGNRTLINEHRLARLLYILPDTRTKPSMTLYVGNRTKTRALKILFPWSNVRGARDDALDGPRIDSAIVGSGYPLLFTDSNPDPNLRNGIYRDVDAELQL